MESRLATRVLWPLKHFECADRETLYKEILQIDWSPWITLDSTFSIDANVSQTLGFRHSHFAGLVMKDAICDQFREKTGERPSIDVRNPAVQLHLFIHKNKATVSFDTSGTPLFKRGYRAKTTQAPLQETLAAAVLSLADYTPDDILCDPFCGSGTFLWEAALIATRTPPGFFRDSFGVFKHPEFSLPSWNTYLQTVQNKRSLLRPYSIFGGDRDLKAIEACRATMTKAGLPLHFQHTDIRLFRPPAIPTLVVTNPPYGIRMSATSNPYAALAQFLETTCQGRARAAILSPLERLPAPFKGSFLKPIPLQNGGLDIFLHRLGPVNE